MAKVQLSEEAVEDFQDLDGAAQRVVAKALKKLATDPHLRGQPLGSRARGDLTTFRKLVVGNRDYRIIYRIEPDGSVVVVWVIAKRADSEAYELAMSRLRLHADATVRELAGSLEQVWDR
ncbi:type II toxin-antitoxin system RelE family toxin [Pseudonocardia sichuanensis]|uniref:mRNA interferase RelE/StbE n=1 Tax=Pseudonocardia kunmingensis TaxID=630975 RepID=A0A543E2U4_9PSEU|nr:type II toxin-antitoxin system RelE/ParE family toxin [Pseudonocardia kunmingensis]TQM15906.1 mRNA interferase RelE/StbE [Pseudonocardia kunmingensis]